MWRMATPRERPLAERVKAVCRALKDNSKSVRKMIVDVFAADRTGLLYTIGNVLYGHEFSVSLAKIAGRFLRGATHPGARQLLSGSGPRP